MYQLNIKIKNLTRAQALAIEDMLNRWQFLSLAGMSRWTAFYADGDGNFKPDILVNDHKPSAINRSRTFCPDRPDGTYAIDPDEVPDNRNKIKNITRCFKGKISQC